MKKLNIIALLVFLAAVGAVLTLNKQSKRSLQESVTSLFSPFIHASANVERSVEKSVDLMPDPRALLRENETLRQKVQGLEIISQKYEQLVEENNNLRQQLEYKQTSPFKVTSARVIKRTASTWWNSVYIDKGALDGIGTDSPVITAVGLVGKTGKLLPHMAEVILLTDELCRVSASVEGTRERGILAGERAGLDLVPDLRLRFLSHNAILNIGANVYSSGDGGVFPSGLLLGKVKRFENKEISGEAVVEPAVDFAKLEHVFVVEMQSLKQ